MLLNNNQSRMVSVPTNFDTRNVTHKDLYPGLNEIDDKLGEALQKHPVLKHQFEDGSLEIVEEAGKPVEFSKLSAKKAAALIKSTADLGQLKTWLESETRAGVKKALQDQVTAIEAPPAKTEES